MSAAFTEVVDLSAFQHTSHLTAKSQLKYDALVGRSGTQDPAQGRWISDARGKQR